MLSTSYSRGNVDERFRKHQETGARFCHPYITETLSKAYLLLAAGVDGSGVEEAGSRIRYQHPRNTFHDGVLKLRPS